MILKNTSNQRWANTVTIFALWHTEITAADAGRFESCLSRKLFGGTWILDGSSIEYHEKKRQRFSLCGVRLEAASNFWSGRKWALQPWFLFTTSLNFSRLLLSLVSGDRRLKAKGDNAVRWRHESNVVIYEISHATFGTDSHRSIYVQTKPSIQSLLRSTSKNNHFTSSILG